MRFSAAYVKFKTNNKQFCPSTTDFFFVDGLNHMSEMANRQPNVKQNISINFWKKRNARFINDFVKRNSQF